MHLTTHGSLLAISDRATGSATLISPDDDVDRGDWLSALAEHGVTDDYLDWDYQEANGFFVWLIQMPVAA
jgi:hypothetical protein